MTFSLLFNSCPSILLHFWLVKFIFKWKFYTGHETSCLVKFNKITMTFELLHCCNFDPLPDLKSPNNMKENIFDCWMHYLYLFGLVGNVKNWDEQIWHCLYKRPKQNGILSNCMIWWRTKTNSDCIGRIVWSTKIFLSSKNFFLSGTIYFSLKL